MRVKVELADAYRVADIGDKVGSLPIVSTFPGGSHAILDVPEGDLGLLDELVRRGVVVDWREERTYEVLWLPPTPGALALVSPGDCFALMGVTEAVRQRGHYGAGVLILHLDTGLDRNHVAFAGKDIRRADPDGHGHGTHTGSTCASSWGIASDAALYSSNVLPGGQGSEAGIANGIREAVDYAVAQRAPAVLTMSLGGGGSQVMDDGCAYARARGVVTVAACGNNYSRDPNPGSPARACDLQVMACDRARAWTDFTDGKNWTTPQRVTAPGRDIAAAQSGTPEGVLVSSGTSMACPHVAGVVALLLAQGYTREEVLSVQRR